MTQLRVFVAGASGVIGVRLVPLLIAAGHTVAGMTRSPAKAESIEELGAEAVVCDVYDADRLVEAVTAFGPDSVLHQLTDLPDDARDIPAFTAANARIRTEGTRNLIAAARAAEAGHLLAQSIAWTPAGAAGVIAQHEQQVLDAGGVVVRYGQLYGPGTYYEGDLPGHPRIQIDEAAKATIPLIDATSPGVVVLAEAE